MAKRSEKKQIYIRWIIDQMKVDPSLSKKLLKAKFIKKYKIGDGAFRNYYKIAEPQFQEMIRVMREAEDIAAIEASVTDIRAGIHSKAEVRMKVQEKIEALENLIISQAISIHWRTVKAIKAINGQPAKPARIVAEKVKRELSPTEIKGYYSELRGWYKELCLLGGYYDPLKVDHSSVDLRDVFANVMIGDQELKH